MTYRCGIGAGLGIQPSEPHVICDALDCGATFEAKPGRGGGPPAWLRDNKAPPGWQLLRYFGGARLDYCPRHRRDRGEGATT